MYGLRRFLRNGQHGLSLGDDPSEATRLKIFILLLIRGICTITPYAEFQIGLALIFRRYVVIFSRVSPLHWSPWPLPETSVTWKPLQHLLDQLQGAPFSPDGYQNFIFQWDRAFYEERVEMVGFEGGAETLDAGCGFGQFSAGLAKYNAKVVACDRSEAMVATARVLAERWNLNNMEVVQASLPSLPFDSGRFDYIWCSGVLMFTDRDASMREFHRMLKPGGRVYVMINSFGRWLFNGIKAYHDGRMTAFKSCLDVLVKDPLDGGLRNHLGFESVEQHCNNLGFNLVAAAHDGCIDLKKQGRERSMYGKSVVLKVDDDDPIELSTLLEFVCEKR